MFYCSLSFKVKSVDKLSSKMDQVIDITERSVDNPVPKRKSLEGQ